MKRFQDVRAFERFWQKCGAGLPLRLHGNKNRETKLCCGSGRVNFLIAFSLCVPSIMLQAGCQQGGVHPVGHIEKIQPVKLSAQQSDAVAKAIRTMLPEHSGTSPTHVKAITRTQGTKIQVCGTVAHLADAPPFYIELERAGETYSAERGQVGTTPKKRAKIAFMCRQN